MTNPGIKYEYTIRKDGLDNDVEKLVYFWQYGRWTECSVTCGTGENRCSLYEPRQLQNKQWRQFKLAVCTHVPESAGFYKDGPGASMSSKCVRRGINEEAVFFLLFLISFIYYPHERFYLHKELQVFYLFSIFVYLALPGLRFSMWDL